MSEPELPAGIVVAGGASRRMGRDKSLLRLDGATLLERAVATLAEVFDEVLVAGGDAPGGARAVRDIFPGIGPLGGIHAGLEATDRAAAFVVACDMPLLDAGVIAKQIALWQETDADALVPVAGGRPEPLHAIYAARCLTAIEDQIGRGDHCVRTLFESVRVRFWEPDPSDARSFANVNTPEEWAAITRAGQAKER